jgi:hypothetical protein
MSKIAEAYVEISAKLDRMEADLKTARSSFAKATGDIQTNANKLQGGMSGLLSKVKAVRVAYFAVAAAIGGTVMAMTSAIKTTADHLDQLDEMSAKTGVSVEMLTSLELAAKQNGISMDQLATSIRMMYRSMNEASEGTKESADAYKLLGVNVKDASGKLKSGNAAFIEVAGALAKIENPAQRSALAMKVFGRAGTEMLPMLEGGEKALRGYIEQAQKLGLVFTESDAKRAAAFNDALDTFNARLRAIKERIVLETLPAITSLMEILTTGKVSKGTEKNFLESGIDDLQKKIDAKLKTVEQLRTQATDPRSNFNDTLVKREEELRRLYLDQYNLRKKLKEINDEIAKGKPTPSATGSGTVAPAPFSSKLDNYQGALGMSTFDWEAAAKKANESALAIRGIKTATDEVISGFDAVPESLEKIKVSIADQLVAPFQDMCFDLSYSWSNTISGWIQGASTFPEAMEAMFDDVVASFANMLAQMAAQELASSLFSGVTGLGLFDGSGLSRQGIDVVGGGSNFASKGTTIINISAIDTQSFAQAVHNNPDAVLSIVNEAQRYGRAN